MSGVDPILAQVIGSALRGVAEEMQASMVRSASSPNITERRDCSAALFDASRRMLAQAASIPVHLGAMPDALAAVLDAGARAGETWILNDPSTGGTHLPDITLVSVITDMHDETPVGFAVTRAHHADVGGMQPGSMPAASRELVQEGLVIPPVLLARDGALVGAAWDLVLANTRTPEERAGDLAAQRSAHDLAERRVREIIGRHGRECVADAADALLAYGSRRTRAAIAAMPDGTYRASDVLEGDGLSSGDVTIRVAVSVRGDEILVDFTGTDSQRPGNVNCPLAVTRSAVYFVVRVATDPDIPASAGAMEPVTVVCPRGVLLNPDPGVAVAAGNVETSSRVVDVVMTALRQAVALPALGQGTMNNVTIGSGAAAGTFTYYETTGGGQGATATGPGVDCVHVAMSNTLTTPVEMIETTYPIRVERHARRRGSGGAGRHRGGDGVVRDLRLLAPADVSIISDRRRIGPLGACGGEPGTPGRNRIDGDEVPSKWSGALPPGTLISIETPGGGGYGVEDPGD